MTGHERLLDESAPDTLRAAHFGNAKREKRFRLFFLYTPLIATQSAMRYVAYKLIKDKALNINVHMLKQANRFLLEQK